MKTNLFLALITLECDLLRLFPCLFMHTYIGIGIFKFFFKSITF